MLRTTLSAVTLAALSTACLLGCESDSSNMSHRTASNRDGTVMPESARTGGTDRYNGSMASGGNMSSGSMSSGSGMGARTASSSEMGNMKISAGDKTFLVCAASSNKAEIAMAEMALKKTNNPQVTQFANQMISDHRMAQDQLMSLARQKGVDIDEDLAPSQRTASYELAKLSGPMFDKQYLGINHGAHLETIGQFRHASMHADDPAIRSWAAQMLPKLESHNSMVEQSMGSMGGMNMGNMGNMNHNMGTMNGNMNNMNR